MREYGTSVVAGVSPGHGGEAVDGIPVYDTMAAARAEAEVDLTVIFVGGQNFLPAVQEAVEGRVRIIVAMAEVIPHLDILRAIALARAAGSTLIGPNTNWMMSPGQAKVGFFPKEFDMPGPVGVISRSGTLSYAALLALQSRGIGQTTIVGIGGAAARGYSAAAALVAFGADPMTRAVVLLGEIGGHGEQEAAEVVRSGRIDKPVLGLVVGRSAPRGREMGHAGALVDAEGSSWQEKTEAMRDAGIRLAETLDELGEATARALS